MKKITVIAGDGGTQCVNVTNTTTETVGGKTVTKTVNYVIPVGVEIAVDDDLFDAAVSQYQCRCGFFVDSEEDIDDLPTTGIADGSYAFVMNGQTVKFLSGGAWV